jgi:formylglycine-generating enzyme required for sulfatase activity
VDETRLNYCDVNCGEDHADESFDDGYAGTALVGSYPDGTSWVGALDLAGNVYEWVADWYGAYPSGQQENPTGPVAGSHRVIRSGSWDNSWSGVRTTYRNYDLPRARYSNYGFRCVSAPSE